MTTNNTATTAQIDSKKVPFASTSDTPLTRSTTQLTHHSISGVTAAGTYLVLNVFANGEMEAFVWELRGDAPDARADRLLDFAEFASDDYAVRREIEARVQATGNLIAVAGVPQNPVRPYHVFEVGDKVSESHYTDVTPGTVVEVKRGGREVHVRADKAQLAEGQKPAISPGGFSGHCTNQRELKYDITEDPKGGVTIFTLRKWRGARLWTQKGQAPDGRQKISHGWRYFYDYNF